MNKKELMYYFETLMHVVGRLSLIEDNIANGIIKQEDTAELIGEENERIANICESLKLTILEDK